MSLPVRVIKIGGVESEDPAFLEAFARVLIDEKEDSDGSAGGVVVVHGGGREVSRLQELLGIPTRTIDGLRVTDAETLRLVEMTLAGGVNKRVVRALADAGLAALGLSGSDLRLLEACALPPRELGFVGRVTRVNAGFLESLLAQRIVPVVAPVACSQAAPAIETQTASHAFNVNADHAALAVATALGARELRFVTNAGGVLDAEGRVVPALSRAEAERLMQSGVIYGGMIPKVRMALDAVAAGVSEVVICGARGRSTGTVFSSCSDFSPGIGKEGTAR